MKGSGGRCLCRGGTGSPLRFNNSCSCTCAVLVSSYEVGDAAEGDEGTTHLVEQIGENDEGLRANRQLHVSLDPVTSRFADTMG